MHKITLVALLRPFVASMFLMLLMATAHAQVGDNPADCNELKDPEVAFQLELCQAHVGCRLVMKIHNSCVKAKKFLTNLKEQVGEGVKGFFGYRKEVTSEHVFEASADDKQRAVLQDKDWKTKVDNIKEAQKKAGKDIVTGNATGGGSWTYIGDVSEGKANGLGTRFFSNGQIERGEFRNNARNGATDLIDQNATRSTGAYISDQMNGEGFRLYNSGGKYKGGFVGNQRNGEGVIEFASGERYEGGFREGAYAGNGVLYRPDGSMWQKGVFEKNELSVGKRFDTQGNVLAEVNKPLDEQRALESKQLAEAAKLRAEQAAKLAAEQASREAAAAAERAYKASLDNMNAGQLFAKADEFSSAGNSAKAREVLRTLISRFPDHALAANAANQLSGMSQAGVGAQSVATTNNAGAISSIGSKPSVTGRPFQECDNNNKNNTGLIAKINAIPKNDTIQLMRGAHFASRWMMENYSQCLPDPRAKEQVDMYRRTVAETLQTCRQLSSNQAICEVSPF